MKLTEDENCLNYSIKNDFKEFFGLHFPCVLSSSYLKAFFSYFGPSTSEFTANLYCNYVYLYWEGCVICSICGNIWYAQ